MKRTVIVGALAAATFSALALAAPDCQRMSGKLTQTVLDTFASPNDPLGRTLDTWKGSTGTMILTSIGPGTTPGTLSATSRHVYIFEAEDQLRASGVAVYTPIPGTADVAYELTLSVQGGTGKYAAATGAIVGTGTLFDFFPLPPGPSAANGSVAELKTTGEVCNLQ